MVGALDDLDADVFLAHLQNGGWRGEGLWGDAEMFGGPKAQVDEPALFLNRLALSELGEVKLLHRTFVDHGWFSQADAYGQAQANDHVAAVHPDRIAMGDFLPAPTRAGHRGDLARILLPRRHGLCTQDGHARRLPLLLLPPLP